MKDNLITKAPNERTITTITLSVALKIGVNEGSNQIEKFSKEGTENEYTDFTHYNFFYSYPEWGKSWPNEKYSEFHRVHTKCHLCDCLPERNYAGIGTIYLLNNGICNDDILINTGYKIIRGKKVWQSEYVPNTPRLSQMILLCQNHIKGYFEYGHRDSKKEKTIQLKLF